MATTDPLVDRARAPPRAPCRRSGVPRGCGRGARAWRGSSSARGPEPSNHFFRSASIRSTGITPTAPPPRHARALEPRGSRSRICGGPFELLRRDRPVELLPQALQLVASPVADGTRCGPGPSRRAGSRRGPGAGAGGSGRRRPYSSRRSRAGPAGELAVAEAAGGALDLPDLGRALRIEILRHPDELVGERELVLLDHEVESLLLGAARAEVDLAQLLVLDLLEVDGGLRFADLALHCLAAPFASRMFPGDPPAWRFIRLRNQPSLDQPASVIGKSGKILIVGCHDPGLPAPWPEYTSGRGGARPSPGRGSRSARRPEPGAGA